MVRALGVDLRHQPPVGGRVDLEEGNLARGERAGLGSAQLDLGRRRRRGRRPTDPTAAFGPRAGPHTGRTDASCGAAEGEMTGGARPRHRGSEKPVGKHGGLSADASVGSVLRTLHTGI